MQKLIFYWPYFHLPGNDDEKFELRDGDGNMMNSILVYDKNTNAHRKYLPLVLLPSHGDLGQEL